MESCLCRSDLLTSHEPHEALTGATAFGLRRFSAAFSFLPADKSADVSAQSKNWRLVIRFMGTGGYCSFTPRCHSSKWYSAASTTECRTAPLATNDGIPEIGTSRVIKSSP